MFIFPASGSWSVDETLPGAHFSSLPGTTHLLLLSSLLWPWASFKCLVLLGSSFIFKRDKSLSRLWMEGICCLVVLLGGGRGWMGLLHQDYPDTNICVSFLLSQLIPQIEIVSSSGEGKLTLES